MGLSRRQMKMASDIMYLIGVEKVHKIQGNDQSQNYTLLILPTCLSHCFSPLFTCFTTLRLFVADCACQGFFLSDGGIIVHRFTDILLVSFFKNTFWTTSSIIVLQHSQVWCSGITLADPHLFRGKKMMKYWGDNLIINRVSSRVGAF